MLSPYRVIDLTNEGGLLCGQILADLGADVIQVEPPGGSTARQYGPWAGARREPEASLFWWAYARNKRSIVCDLETEAGRETVRQLAAGADFFIESERPGALTALGLGYRDLAESNPGLVYVSITPFGQSGPKSQWAATDLTLMAASGHAYLSGDEHHPPVRLRVPQAHAHAGADAAVGALIAHAARQRTGRGQHVDVSAQQSSTLATMFRILDTPLEQAPAQRVAGGAQVGPAFLRGRYELADGWVVLGPAFLPSTGHFMQRLLSWVAEEGFIGPERVDEPWGTYGLRMIGGQVDADDFDEVEAALDAFFATRTREELMAAAVDRRLLLAPILSLDQIVESKQFGERGFVVELEQGAQPVRFPGPWARFGATSIESRHAAPTVDEHGAALRAEPPRQPAFVPERAAVEAQRPLEGVKILDLFWVLAGPGATRMLADYGATVIRVESTSHVDTLRVIPPYHYSNPHPECSGGFQSANANKLGLTLDLSNPDAREVLLDLVRWCDVVTESFAPGVIDGYGFGWDVLSNVKPDLIMISSCLMGQTGPWANFTGFGNLAASVTGFQQLASWPDSPPSGPFGAYTDFISVRYNAIAILAALEHRARTGAGQYIDQSQAEAALHFLAPAFLDYTVNGNVQGPAGNADGDLSPHGMFPAAGEDSWVAIAVDSSAAWEGLCNAVGRVDLLDRRAETAIVEEAIAAWTRERDAASITAALQAVGVPVHEASTTPQLFEDPQLQHRDHFLEVLHDIFPTSTVESSRLLLSESPARKPERALSFGRDNQHVLSDLLGYSPEKIAELQERGALT